MSSSAQLLRVDGTVASGSDGRILVMSRRLDGLDTFLFGKLEVLGAVFNVRILTFDDVTVLHMVDESAGLTNIPTWAGVLHLPHGLRASAIPRDLADAAIELSRDLGALDEAELRYALTFLHESSSNEIRSARIRVIVDALPTIDGGAR